MIYQGGGRDSPAFDLIDQYLCKGVSFPDIALWVFSACPNFQRSFLEPPMA